MKNKKKNLISISPTAPPPESVPSSKSLSEPALPEKIYPNSDTCKEEILSENKNKSGIYMWTNNINPKIYIGSSENLRARFQQYLNINCLIQNNCMPICRALVKHGHYNFSLEILEYCEVSDLLIREKHYISLYKPKYNIVQYPTLNPMSGRQHSEKTKQIMSDAKKGKTLSDETKTRISDAAKKSDNSGRFKSGQQRAEGAGMPSQIIEVTDILNNQTTTYDSIHEAARALNINHTNISKYFSRNQQKPYKNRYTFKKL